jgi:hypothetical protein
MEVPEVVSLFLRIGELRRNVDEEGLWGDEMVFVILGPIVPETRSRSRRVGEAIGTGRGALTAELVGSICSFGSLGCDLEPWIADDPTSLEELRRWAVSIEKTLAEDWAITKAPALDEVDAQVVVVMECETPGLDLNLTPFLRSRFGIV